MGGFGGIKFGGVDSALGESAVQLGLLQRMKVGLVCLVLVFIRESAGSADCPTELSPEARLRSHLFCNYDHMARPVEHFSNQTLVEFQLYPTKIYMDEHEEVIAFQGNILYVWSDAFLQWDPREYEGLNFMRVRSTEIWFPDISVNAWSHSTSSLAVNSGGDCHLTHTGYVYCFIRTTLQAPCTPDITTYPFDSQNCTIIFSSSGFFGRYINFTFLDPAHGVKMTLYKPNKFWQLKEVTARREVRYLSVEDESDFYPLIRCNFILNRHSAGLAAILVLPAAVLAGLSLLVYWMDSMYTTRIGVAAVVILSDVIYCIYLGIMLPSNGDRVPIIVTFFRDSIVIACASVVVTILVRNVSSRTTPPSHRLTDILAKIDAISCLHPLLPAHGPPNHDDTLDIIDPPPGPPPSPWHPLAALIDRTAFALSCLTYAVLLLFYLP